MSLHPEVQKFKQFVDTSFDPSNFDGCSFEWILSSALGDFQDSHPYTAPDVPELIYIVTWKRSDGTTPKLVKAYPTMFFTYEEAENQVQSFPKKDRIHYEIRPALVRVGKPVTSEVHEYAQD